MGWLTSWVDLNGQHTQSKQLKTSLSCTTAPKSLLHSLALRIPVSTLHKVLHERTLIHTYKLKLLQKNQDNKPTRHVLMLNHIVTNEHSLNEVIFFGWIDASSHSCGHSYNVWIWGSKNPHIIFEMERDSQNINVWCGRHCSDCLKCSVLKQVDSEPESSESESGAYNWRSLFTPYI